MLARDQQPNNERMHIVPCYRTQEYTKGLPYAFRTRDCFAEHAVQMQVVLSDISSQIVDSQQMLAGITETSKWEISEMAILVNGL